MSDKPEDRWQSKITTIPKGILEVHKNKQLCDVSIWVENQEFKCHKLALAARSSVFQKLLLDKNEDKISIKDESITAVGFDILVRFIYTDKLATEDKKSIIQAYLAAIYFDQKKLQILCEKRIESWNITKDNVWQLLNAGYTFPLIRYKCISFIRNNINDSLSSPSFLEIGLGCLNILLDSGVLKEVPAMKALRKIMDWAAKHYVTDSKNYSSVREEFQKNGILSKLGFERLSVPEITEVVNKYNNFLMSDEVLIFLKYSSNKDVESLPGCFKPSI